MEMNEGIFLVHDDNEIRKVLSKINLDSYVVEFFANHEINAPVFAQDMLVISDSCHGRVMRNQQNLYS